MLNNDRESDMQSTMHTGQILTVLLDLSLICVWEIHPWHSMTCGERRALWSYVQLNPVLFPASRTTLLFCIFIRDMSSYSVVVDNARNLSHDVQWREDYEKGAEMWKLHLPSMVFLLCHLQMRHFWGRGWAEGQTVMSARKIECLFVWVSGNVCAFNTVLFVKKSWSFYPGGLDPHA